MTQIVEIVTAGGSVDHGGLGAGGLGGADDDRRGIGICVDLGAVGIGIVQGHALHTEAVALIVDHGQRIIGAIVQLGQIRIGCHRLRRHGQSRSHQHKTQTQSHQLFECDLHKKLSFCKMFL